MCHYVKHLYLAKGDKTKSRDSQGMVCSSFIDWNFTPASYNVSSYIATIEENFGSVYLFWHVAVFDSIVYIY